MGEGIGVWAWAKAWASEARHWRSERTIDRVPSWDGGRVKSQLDKVSLIRVRKMGVSGCPQVEYQRQTKRMMQLLASNAVGQTGGDVIIALTKVCGVS